MRRLALSLLLLLMPTLACGQITVGDSIPPADVQNAQNTLDRAKPKILKLNAGEFEVIEPAKGITAALLWVPLQSKLYETYVIEANTTHTHDGIRRGETKRRVHRFLPVPYVRTLMIASLENAGQTVVTIVKSGEKPELLPVPIDTVDVTVGVPKPDPPKPPEPTPIDPVDPKPVVGPLRVLILWESRDVSSLPSAQVQATTAKEFLDYIDSHCIKVDNQPEYRKFDKDVDKDPVFAKLPQVWQDGINRALGKDQLHPESRAKSWPWIVISNEKSGYEGELPKNKDELLKLLKTYGGP